MPESRLSPRPKRRPPKRAREPFDLHKLETLCDTSQAGRMAEEGDRQATYECMYYVEYKNMRTLQEFAAIVERIAPWS